MNKVKAFWQRYSPAFKRQGAIVAVCTIVTLLLVSRAAQEPSAYEKIIDSYLSAVEKEDFFSAQQKLCSELKQQAPNSEILERQTNGSNARLNFGRIESHKITDTEKNSGGGLVRAEVHYGGSTIVDFNLYASREQGEYRFCGISARSQKRYS